MLQDYDLSLLQVHCKRQEILCKKRKKERKEKKKKSMISMLRSSLLSSKKGERRYPKTSTTKFFSWRESLQEQSRIRLATKYSHTHAHLDLRV
jgi:hypothetical protein